MNYSTMLKSLLIIKLEVIINYNEPVHQNQVKYDKRHVMDKDCKNLNSCCKLELENIFISCFNNSSLHYWVTFEKNIFFFTSIGTIWKKISSIPWKQHQVHSCFMFSVTLQTMVSNFRDTTWDTNPCLDIGKRMM